MFKKITIIGVGEIGGSVGLASRRKLAKEVVGVCRRKSSARKALRANTVDRVTLDLKEGARGADFIILATPVNTIVELGKKAAFEAREGALITDVGSTKKYIVESLERALPEKVSFVGSHPMAGSEKGGPESACKALFKNRDCFITRTKNTDRHALKKVKKFWISLGAKPRVVSLAEHDTIVAGISQMVHVVAAALVISNSGALKYAASGFRDATRIAMADPLLWRDICVTNSANITKSLNALIAILKDFRKAISEKDTRVIEAMLGKARDLRRRFRA